MEPCRPITFSEVSINRVLTLHKTQTRRLGLPPPPGPSFTYRMVDAAQGRAALTGPDGDVLELACPIGKPGDVLWVRENWGIVHRPPMKYPQLHSKCVVPPPGVDSQYPGITWRAAWFNDEDSLTNPDYRKARSSRFMPKWASRVHIEIVNVWPEQLGSISEKDALAEGVRSWSKDGSLWKYWHCDFCCGPDPKPWRDLPKTAREAFLAGWDKINGKRHHPNLLSLDCGKWFVLPFASSDANRKQHLCGSQNNPWVWAVEFKLAWRWNKDWVEDGKLR